MGSVAKPIATGLGAVATGGLSLIPGNNPFSRVGGDIGTALTGGANGGSIVNPFNGQTIFGGNGGSSSGTPGPFSLDPTQLAGDTSAITGLGTSQSAAANNLATQQYQQTMSQAPQLISNQLALDNPAIEESLNSTGQLDSTAYPTALAHEQAQLSNAIALPALQQEQQQQQGAQQNLFGSQQAGVGRQLSLEDFVNQANVAKTIGAAAAPQVGNGKGQTGTLLSGIGSVAGPAATLAKGIGKGAGAAGAGTAASSLLPAAADAMFLA